MVSKRRSQETTTPASPQKKTKAEELPPTTEEEKEVVEEKETEEEKLTDEEKEEMEVIDEAKGDDATEEDKKEKEYTVDMPDNIDGIPDEAVEKTQKALERGKIAVLKYVEAIDRACEVIKAMFPDVTRDAQEASLTVLKEFKEEVKTVPKLKLSDETKKAFAYHVEICKTGMPNLFEEPAEAETKEEPQETDVQKLFKKAPKLSVGAINDVINRGSKIVKEKKTLLNDLNDLNTKMQIVDNLLCLQLVEPNPDEKKAWQFFQENADQLLEVFPSLGATELVILDFCKTLGNKILEKMSICRKNWTTLGTQLPSKSPSVSSLVYGPVVTADMLSADKIVTAETRATLLNVVAGIKKKINNNVTDYVKNLMSKEDAESFQYIVNDLEGMIGKQQNKPLVPEEKLYIGYHLSKVRPHVSRIAELNASKTVLEGNYVFHDRPEFTERKSFGSPRGGSGRGGSFSKRGVDFKKSGGASGYRGNKSGFRGRGSGFRGNSPASSGYPKSFNHHGAY